MNGSELHAQASVWENHGGRTAVLFMEGEARDRSNGGGTMAEALYRVALARGLRLTTDLEHMDRRPIPGWRMLIDEERTVTLDWPHFWPLLAHVPLDLPEAWMRVAAADHLVFLFVGYGLGMHEHARDDLGHPLVHLEHAAETGALAAGAVTLVAANGR